MKPHDARTLRLILNSVVETIQSLAAEADTHGERKQLLAYRQAIADVLYNLQQSYNCYLNSETDTVEIQ